MSKLYFVTGTDTGVGKTTVSVCLIKTLNQLGYSTLGIKPIASGAEYIQGHLRNQDAIALQQVSSIKMPYDKINPFVFQLPIAPHIAAKKTNTLLNCQTLSDHCREALNTCADCIILEGAGGWLVPLNERESMADWVRLINANVIVVVGIRLGCLNHAQLTVQAIQKLNLPICGWFANCLDNTASFIDEQIYSLKCLLNIPCLGVLDYNKTSNLDYIFPIFDPIS